MPIEGEEASLTPLAGGKGGETFLATVGGERTIVRIYGRSWARRGDGAAEIDAATLRLVRGLVPVADVIEVRRGNADNGLPPLLVTSFVEGARLDTLLPKLREKELRAAAREVGIALSRLAQMPMLTAGPFLDGNLRLGAPPSHMLSDWLDVRLERGSALSEWTKADLDALRGYALHCQGLLTDVTRYTLVHGDFDAKNLLVDPTSFAITAVVDWESACAGSPFTDLGSALRSSTATIGKRATIFDETVLEVFAERVPDALGADASRASRTSVELDRLHAKARAADLLALVDLASNPAMNPTAQAAHDLLLSNVRAFRARS